MATIGSNAMKPLVVGAGAPSAGGTAGGATLTPWAGSTGNGPDGAGGGADAPAPAPAPRPPPPPPARPPPDGSGVDHASTVLNFGPRLTWSSFPLYISFIVARPFASRTRSVNTSSIN